MNSIEKVDIVSVVEINSDFHSTCSRAVSSAVEAFDIEDGHAVVPNDLCPLEVLFTTLHKISSIFDLDVAPGLDLKSRESLHRILQASFDTNTQNFLEQETSEIFARLSSCQKTRILAQAIAVTATIFRRLAETQQTITWGLLNREAQLFAESDQRELMQRAIEQDAVFSGCKEQREIADSILDAMEHEEFPSSPVAADDKTDFNFSITADQERTKNMGVPWGFTIMTLN